MTSAAHVWDKTLSKGNEWLTKLGYELACQNAHVTLFALRSVLHALRDRLPPDEAVDLAAQMPLIIKGLYFDGWDPSAGPNLVLIKDPLIADPEACGSYMVYWKLEQDVEKFRKMELRFAEALRLDGTQEGLDYAAALLVGRYRDGRTLAARASIHRNDFDFEADVKYPTLCPFHSHIRKANPRRNDRVGDDFRMRRVARRSMPYGIPESPSSDASASDSPVGLLFMCLQASVNRQFEFIVRSWINDRDFPTNKTGDDPILGQGIEPQHWHTPRVGPTDFSFESVVTDRGGGYFFTPSIPFLMSPS